MSWTESRRGELRTIGRRGNREVRVHSETHIENTEALELQGSLYDFNEFDARRYDDGGIGGARRYGHRREEAESTSTDTLAPGVPSAANSRLADVGGGNNFVDWSDWLGNRGWAVEFWREAGLAEGDPTSAGSWVKFKAFITTYTETFSVNTNTNSVYGRNIPIAQYKNTARNVTLSFVVPASTPSEAFDNLYRIDRLTSFLYPTDAWITRSGRAMSDGFIGYVPVIGQNPFVRLRIANLLTDGKTSNTYTNMFSEQDPASDEQTGESTGIMNLGNGALAVIKSVSVNHNLENNAAGIFPGGSENQWGTRSFVPQLMEVSVDLTILHEIQPAYAHSILGSTAAQQVVVSTGATPLQGISATSQVGVHSPDLVATDYHAHGIYGIDWNTSVDPRGTRFDEDPDDAEVPLLPGETEEDVVAAADAAINEVLESDGIQDDNSARSRLNEARSAGRAQRRAAVNDFFRRNNSRSAGTRRTAQ